MGSFANIISLLIKLIFLSCFISLVAAARHNFKAQLATKVCRNTTDFRFCRKTLYSDPRTPTADRVLLAYIAFDKAYLNISNTQTQVQLKIMDSGDEKTNVVDGLKSCTGHYTNAIGALSRALENLDSDSYYDLDKFSIGAQSHVRNCEESFNGTITSPMTKENRNLIKLTDICYAVAQLFPYTD